MGGAREEIALEIGPQRKVFAWAPRWAGWCRSAKDEPSALAALVTYAPRYARVAEKARLRFRPPDSIRAFEVVERVKGSAVTDFGAPAALSRFDTSGWDRRMRDRLARLLQASWDVFDAALAGVPLRLRSVKPRVGRAPAELRFHVLETDVMHLSAFGPAFRKPSREKVAEGERVTRQRIVDAVKALPVNQVAIPARRYGFDWTPGFAIRRSAWHALDHAWELEDRSLVSRR